MTFLNLPHLFILKMNTSPAFYLGVVIGTLLFMAWMMLKGYHKANLGEYLIRKGMGLTHAAQTMLVPPFAYKVYRMDGRLRGLPFRFDRGNPLVSSDNLGLAALVGIQVQPSLINAVRVKGFNQWGESFGSDKWMAEVARPQFEESARSVFSKYPFEDWEQGDPEAYEELRKAIEAKAVEFCLNLQDLDLEILEPHPVPLPQNA